MYGAPPESINWPIPSGGSSWKPSDDLPDLLYDSPSLSDPGESEPGKRFLQAEDMKKLCRTWRQIRLEYPGWVVASKENRDGLWRYTERWIEPVLQSVKELSPPENLFLSQV